MQRRHAFRRIRVLGRIVQIDTLRPTCSRAVLLAKSAAISRVFRRFAGNGYV